MRALTGAAGGTFMRRCLTRRTSETSRGDGNDHDRGPDGAVLIAQRRRYVSALPRARNVIRPGRAGEEDEVQCRSPWCVADGTRAAGSHLRAGYRWASGLYRVCTRPEPAG